MRLLAAENFPRASIEALRTAGHDVVSIADEASGSSDRLVLGVAKSSERVIITFDRDFGDLVYRQGQEGWPGIVLLRFVPHHPLEPAELLLAAIAEGAVLEGFFNVLTPSGLRQRRLPRATKAECDGAEDRLFD